jgi:hypothetical protein
MQSKLAYAAGILGMAVLGVWIALRRNSSVARQFAGIGLPSLELDDDAAAGLIRQYRPAVERALSGLA